MKPVQQDAVARRRAFASKLPYLRPRETKVSDNHQSSDFEIDSARPQQAALHEHFPQAFGASNSMVMGMSNDDPTLYEDPEVPQYGEDIKEPGEPFGEGTLDTIRTLVAEDDVVAGVAQDVEMRRATPAVDGAVNEPEAPVLLGATALANASAADLHDWVEAPRARQWRKIEIVEGGPGRALRRFLTTPRLLSIAFLSGVVYWQPYFIPMLVLALVSVLLLVGALIGQDRMGRFVMRRIQRFIWADPALARALEKVTPYRMRRLLYRPASEEDVWDGPIDPSFAARISRIHS